jgi:diguanylate cyclase (GGDEF)-like protein
MTVPTTWRHRSADRAGAAARAYDTDTAWAVLPVSVSLVIFFAGLAALHRVTAGSTWSTAMTVAPVVSCVLAAAVALLAWRRQIPDYWGHGVITGLITVATAYAGVMMLSTRDPQETTTFILVVVGCGAGLLRPRWFVGCVAGIWLAWLVCVASVGGSLDEWDHWVFFMLAASALATVVIALRRRSIDAATAAIRRASQAATEDPATGLLNRRGLSLLSREVVGLARRQGDAVFCTFLDVDGLKSVNDRYGHDAGDRVILAVAQAIRSVARATDVAARWGGDEFVVVGLGVGMPPDEFERRIRGWLRQHFPSDATLAALRVSVGHALLEPWDEGDVERLLWVADRDMYARRAQGRGRGHTRGIVTVDGTTQHGADDAL